jgi:hypothetical protein
MFVYYAVPLSFLIDHRILYPFQIQFYLSLVLSIFLGVRQVNEERGQEFIFQSESIPEDQTLINFDPPYKIACH